MEYNNLHPITIIRGVDPSDIEYLATTIQILTQYIRNISDGRYPEDTFETIDKLAKKIQNCEMELFFQK